MPAARLERSSRHGKYDVTPDCERLDAYRVAVDFQVLAASIGSGRRLGALRDQLDRASVSIVLNIAEGSGRFAPAERAHFYLIARGSAMECLAAVSLLQARSLVTDELYRRCRSLLTRVVAMLTRLATAMQVRADAARLGRRTRLIRDQHARQSSGTGSCIGR